jgi:hypothetical protein
MAPIVPILIAAIGAGVALAASSSKKKGPPKSGSYELDTNLPADSVKQVLGAIANVTDPDALAKYADQMQQAGFPLAADALRQRAAELRAHAPPGPAPQPSNGVTPPGPPPPPLPSPEKVLWDGNLDDATRAAVLQAIASESDPSKLQAFADSIAAQFPLAAEALRARALALPQAQPAPAPPGPAVIPGGGGQDYPPAPAPKPAPPPAPSPNGTPPAPPPQGQVWVLAQNADVARDGTQPRYNELLSSQPVGYEVHELHNARLWKFRVISNKTDPGLTSFAKDVKGWIAMPSTVIAPPTPPAPAPALAPAPVVVAPPAPPAPHLPPPPPPPLVQPVVYMPQDVITPAPATPDTPIQARARTMRDALNAHGYKQLDQPIYKAFEALAFNTSSPDGFPGSGTMSHLKSVLDSLGLPMPNVPIYPWHSMLGTTGYNGVNAPTWAQWTSPIPASAASAGNVWGPS